MALSTCKSWDAPPTTNSNPTVKVNDVKWYLHSLKVTFSHLKMDDWKTIRLPFGAFRPVIRGELLVSGSIPYIFFLGGGWVGHLTIHLENPTF